MILNFFKSQTQTPHSKPPNQPTPNPNLENVLFAYFAICAIIARVIFTMPFYRSPIFQFILIRKVL